MMPLVVLAALIVVPLILMVWLRINAALVFLSLCLGSVLVQFVGSDVVSVVSGASTSVYTTGSSIRLVLLLAPAVLTMLFMFRTVKPSMRIMNAIPAIGTGFLVALLAVPLLPASTARSVIDSNAWTQINSLQSAIVATSAIVCLLFLWMQRPKSEKHGKHGKA